MVLKSFLRLQTIIKVKTIVIQINVRWFYNLSWQWIASIAILSQLKIDDDFFLSINNSFWTDKCPYKLFSENWTLDNWEVKNGYLQ